MSNDNGGLSAWLAADSDPDPFFGPVRTNGVRTNGVGVLLDDAAVSGRVLRSSRRCGPSSL